MTFDKIEVYFTLQLFRYTACEISTPPFLQRKEGALPSTAEEWKPAQNCQRDDPLVLTDLEGTQMCLVSLERR